MSNVDSIEKSPHRGSSSKAAKVKALLQSPVNKALSPERTLVSQSQLTNEKY
jgi:hypothetical protein